MLHSIHTKKLLMSPAKVSENNNNNNNNNYYYYYYYYYYFLRQLTICREARVTFRCE